MHSVIPTAIFIIFFLLLHLNLVLIVKCYENKAIASEFRIEI